MQPSNKEVTIVYTDPFRNVKTLHPDKFK